MIIEEADRLASLVDGILRAGGAPKIEEVNLHRITEHVAHLIEAEKPERVELVRDYDPSLPPVHVDRHQMIQAFLNIARNAMQAVGKQGRLVFRTRALPNFTLGGEQHRLVLSAEVEDNGPGIPDELKDTIFYPLVTGKAMGTGLGLTIAQDLVSRNGGLIEFVSQPGRTVFQLRLPCGEGMAARRMRAAGTRPTVRQPRRAQLMATPGLSVWVVDDDESVRWVLEQALKQAHMIPRVFEGGRQFFTALERDRPDVLVTDIRMPDMTGLELMEKLAQTDPDIPVIVITAHSDLDSAVAAYQSGAFEYLPKPFDIDEAMELVSRAARQRSRGPAAQTEPKPQPRIIGQAPAMQDVFKAIGRLSRSSMTVLITGESGTGKELVSRALARQLAARERTVRRAQHVRDSGRAARVRAVRPREGRFHGRDRAAHRPLRAGERRHVVPRRDRRHVARAADAAAARARRKRVLPRRRPIADPRRRARDRGDAPGSRELRADRPLPRRPLPPPERDADRSAAAAQPPRGHPRAHALLPRAGRQRARRRAKDAEQRGGRRAAKVRLARQRPRARERLPPAYGHGRGTRDRGAGPAARARRHQRRSRSTTGPRASRNGPRVSSPRPRRRRC